MWLRKSSRALLIAAGELGKGGRAGTQRATCPCTGKGVGAAKAHGEAREGDEGDQDERQRVTETRKACGRTKEEDIGEEDDDAQECTIPVVGTALRRRKRRGEAVQREDDDEGGLLDINGEARGGRGSDADDHSG